jgi:LPXTG-motif cell wall-anchored protein
MAPANYTSIYGTDEVEEPWIDLVTGIGSMIYNFAPLLALLLLGAWASRKRKKVKI